MSKVCVISSGGWGTAVAIHLHTVGHTVSLWSYTKEEADVLNTTRENKNYLLNVKIPNNIIITNDERIVNDADFIINTTVSKFTRSTLSRFAGHIEPSQIIVNMSKGLEEDSLLRISQVISELFPQNPLAVLSGPSHAEEVARGKITTCVVASNNQIIAEKVQDAFMSSSFRVYTSSDVVGVELGGTLKNIVALAAGVCDGLELGDNAKAALMTRGMAEICRLGEAMGAKNETFLGLAGMGDLIVTCTSMHSRNRRAGILLGRGMSLDETLKTVGMAVEGVYAVKSALSLAKQYNVEMPITVEMSKLLFEGKPVYDLPMSLMGREKKNEI